MADIDREREVLLRALRSQRKHVLGILEGLPEEALRRPALPSGWSCLGLVQHLALDVERFWFRGVIAGEPEAQGGWPDAWQVAADVPAGQVLDRYRDETARADAIIAASPLSRPAAWWPDDLPGARLQDLREIIVHVVTETATHAGHLDAARELTDGRTWLVLD